MPVKTGPKRRQLLTDPQYSRHRLCGADGRAMAGNGVNILAARLQVLGAEGEMVRGPEDQQASSHSSVCVYYAVKGKGVAE